MHLGPLHASAVAFGPERGVLILGPSGAGKSQLALALIGLGAELVADDRVQLMGDGGALFARPPRTIAGLIEARGLGLLRLTHRRLARIVLAVDLAESAERLPEPRTRSLAGITLACLPGRPDEGFARALAHYLLGRGARV
ncbi:MAG: serine kinase [Rhodobacter sp.]|uniref:HPr kinase/phosphorylase n=1 Tax=Pararhodobacter sp. TaxID=2127056 RepID=UPI001DCD3E80|nr:serine kinase [Pararhodobacter sp.]MCB1345311.1 serine kinase [Paracoccaceae bacterium]MCB1408171.1 serine kinase [Paracoccaceae bacterium]MCC0072542.1 serine kinase [Rhodobacter sp.]HPD93004.1 serine kinase [Pararhodobacter sp.]